MKKIYVKPVKQNGKIFYTTVLDPRDVADLIPEVEAGAEQDTQRPWVENKVKDIANYVVGEIKIGKDSKNDGMGIIPNSPILVLNEPFEVKCETLKIIHTDETEDMIEVYYIEFPTTSEELELLKGTVLVLDGQHRVRAFMDEYMNPEFNQNSVYEMVFNIFFDLDTEQKKELFVVTNDKQEKMSTNLLRSLKRALGLLDEYDEITSLLIERLNTEGYSPLRNRIMTGGEKLSKGYSEIQLSKIFKYTSPDFKGYVGQTITDSTKISSITLFSKVLSNYLKAWESKYTVNFQTPGKDTLTKISGLRYILLLLPKINDILVHNQLKATKENFVDILSELHVALGTENIFEVNNLAFRGEGATVKLAKDHSEILFNHYQQTKGVFDPMEGL